VIDAAGNQLYAYQPYQAINQTLGTEKILGAIIGYNGDGTPIFANVAQAPTLNAGQYTMLNAGNHNMGINAIDGNTYGIGNRYLSTSGNPIAGEGKSINDQFMRVNAFLGNADLSMILHMLSQRSDTDLLSAPKVVTKSGQEAVMKVVTEYIYPTEYEVQISQQSSSGSITAGGSSDPLAIVEPQNFEMREVGIILQVVPEVSAEGQMINLMLNPQVVSEPVWKNYGTKVPKTTYRAPTAEERIWLNPTATSVAQTEYIDLPMEQPFFHVRSVQTQLSVYNGATVVMGGLITESRKTMEDKIPFLGDLPYVGRLFRSRSEESDKRNLLVFVTARLVDPAGRAVRMSGESALLSGGGGAASPVSQQGAEAAAQPAAAAPQPPQAEQN
jgi:general secretion pathway protein D